MTRFAQTSPHDATARESRVPDTAVSWDAVKKREYVSTESKEMPYRSFEKDINWMERNKRDMQSNPIPRMLAVVVLVIGILAAGSTAVVNASSTAADRPDWQSGNSIQNMYENYAAWAAYTNTLDAEMAEPGAPFADLNGENFSVTLELLAHFEDNAYPTGTCAQDFYYVWTRALEQWAHFYGAWYYNITSITGEPIDTGHIATEYDSFQEYYFNQDGISANCWAKLDT